MAAILNETREVQFINQTQFNLNNVSSCWEKPGFVEGHASKHSYHATVPSQNVVYLLKGDIWNFSESERIIAKSSYFQISEWNENHYICQGSSK